MGKGTPLFSTKFGSAHRTGWGTRFGPTITFSAREGFGRHPLLLPLPSRQGLGLYWEAQKSFWVIPLILGIYCALILICVAPLCGFHMYLIGTAQTTRCVGGPVSFLGAPGVRFWHAGETQAEATEFVVNFAFLPRQSPPDEPRLQKFDCLMQFGC